jgi:hypothetical protein
MKSKFFSKTTINRKLRPAIISAGYDMPKAACGEYGMNISAQISPVAREQAEIYRIIASVTK